MATPITRIFHVNVNVSDMDRSIKFYEGLGFTMGRTGDVDTPGISKAFKTKSGRLRWAHMHIGDDAAMTKIDLVQWYDGDQTIPPRKELDSVGLARFSLLVDDVDKAYDEFKAKGYEFVAPPDAASTDFGDFRLCTIIDPDGVNVQLIQPPSGV